MTHGRAPMAEQVAFMHNRRVVLAFRRTVARTLMERVKSIPTPYDEDLTRWQQFALTHRTACR